MASGKVKWWNNRKGFGFISQEAGGDVFMHHKALSHDARKWLREGEPLIFDIVPSEKGLRAENIRRPPAG
jgi:cold shock protein